MYNLSNFSNLTGVISWIGLFTTQNSSYTEYYWIDNSTLDFENWAGGEPNGNGPDGYEGCVQIYSNNGKWNDVVCTDKLGYICQIPKGRIFCVSICNTVGCIFLCDVFIIPVLVQIAPANRSALSKPYNGLDYDKSNLDREEE